MTNCEPLREIPVDIAFGECIHHCIIQVDDKPMMQEVLKASFKNYLHSREFGVNA